jgi:hypothetical protein
VDAGPATSVRGAHRMSETVLRRRRVNPVGLLSLLVCVLLAACAPASVASPGPSASPVGSPAGGPPTVAGTVTAGPVCPVESSSPDPGCAARPVAGAVIVATDASGQEVGRATSAADGTCELIVTETGTVRITAQPVTGLARPPDPVDVTLTFPTEVHRVDLEYDTGIR